jgi:PAS domain-containing protein
MNNPLGMSEWLNAASPDTVSRWRRLRVLNRQAMNEGVWAFVLSMVLATTAAILLRVYIMNQLALSREITKEVSTTIGTEQEPSDDVSRTGLVSAALAQVNSANRNWGCSPVTSPLQTSTQELESCKAIDRLADHVDKSIRDIHSGGITASEQQELDEWTERLRTAAVDERNDGLCAPPASGGWAYVLVPRQLARAASGETQKRILRAIRFSAALDRGLDELARDVDVSPSNRGGKAAELVQSYFISSESVLRIWNRGQLNACRSFSPTRLWASKSYFEPLWQTDVLLKRTLAYVDYGGNGLVQTTCKPIRDPDTIGNEAGKYRSLLGIVCSDFRLDINTDRRVLRAVTRHLFFQTALVQFRILSGPVSPRDISVSPTTSSDTQVAGTPLGEHGSDPRETAIDEQDAPYSISDIQNAVSRIAQNPTEEMRRNITKVPFGNEVEGFLLPIEAPENVISALLFVPRSPRLPASEQAFAVIALFIIAGSVAAAYSGWSQAQEVKGSKSRLAMLRNLQVGIVQVDAEERILASNDRAEELFGCELPKFGFELSGPEVTFDQLIEAETVIRIVPEHERPSPHEKWESSKLKEAKEMRLRGQESSYYAKLRRGKYLGGWIRVSATPMMLARRERRRDVARLGTVFASVEEVDASLWHELDAYVEIVNARRALEGGGR